MFMEEHKKSGNRLRLILINFHRLDFRGKASSKGSHSAMSALTLLAFLFFIHLLQVRHKNIRQFSTPSASIRNTVLPFFLKLLLTSSNRLLQQHSIESGKQIRGSLKETIVFYLKIPYHFLFREVEKSHKKICQYRR
jgi:hypothetical protein